MVEAQEIVSSEPYLEHRKNIKKQIEDQKIILNGESLDIYDEDAWSIYDDQEKAEARGERAPKKEGESEEKEDDSGESEENVVEESFESNLAKKALPYDPQIFMIWQSHDEREPHRFLKFDSLMQNGLVKDWTIKELDLVHAERDDELVLR